MPALERIKIVHTSDSKREIRLFIDGESYKLNEMSDGTLKMMLLTVLLHTPEKMTMLSLDEPELNIHPAWLRILSNWIVRSSSSEQIFVSSHSPDLLDGFTNGFLDGDVGLFVFNTNENETLRAVQYDDLKNFIEDGWQLGDLYRVGEPRLGGWPW